jgi:hypothetical protein
VGEGLGVRGNSLPAGRAIEEQIADLEPNELEIGLGTHR